MVYFGLFMVSILGLSCLFSAIFEELINEALAQSDISLRQAVHALNNTASQFAAHSTTSEAATGLPVAAFGFMPCLLLGLKKG